MSYTIDSATIIVPNTSVIKATLADQETTSGGGTISNVLTMPETGFLAYTLTVGGTSCAAQIKQPSTDYRFAGLISTNWTQTSGIMPVKKGQQLNFLTTASSTASASIRNLIIFGSEVA